MNAVRLGKFNPYNPLEIDCLFRLSNEPNRGYVKEGFLKPIEMSKILTETEYKEYMKNNLIFDDGEWFFLKNNNDFIGFFIIKTFKPYTPYIIQYISEKYRGQGYATAGQKVLLNLLFKYRGYTDIIAEIYNDNPSSMSVAKSLGFKLSTETGRFILHNPFLDKESEIIAEQSLFTKLKLYRSNLLYKIGKKPALISPCTQEMSDTYDKVPMRDDTNLPNIEVEESLIIELSIDNVGNEEYKPKNL